MKNVNRSSSSKREIKARLIRFFFIKILLNFDEKNTLQNDQKSDGNWTQKSHNLDPVFNSEKASILTIQNTWNQE